MDIWYSSEDPILLSVRRSYLVAKRDYRISVVKDNIANPATKVDYVAFEGMVVEPHKEHANIWQFKIIDGNKVEGRPTGGSRRDHQNSVVIDSQTGKKRRRKQGEWFDITWVPEAAINAAISGVETETT